MKTNLNDERMMALKKAEKVFLNACVNLGGVEQQKEQLNAVVSKFAEVLDTVFYSVLEEGFNEKVLKEIIKKYEKLKDAVVEYDLDRRSLLGYTNLLLVLNRNDDAIFWYNQLLKVFEEAGNGQDCYATICNSLGLLYLKKGEYSLVEKYLKKSLETYKDLSVSNPEKYNLTIAASCLNLASVYMDEKKYTDAEILFKEALSFFEKSGQRDHLKDVATIYGYLVAINIHFNKYHRVLEYFNEAILVYKSLEEKDLKENFPNLAKLYKDMGNYVKDHVSLSKSEFYFEQALFYYEILYKQGSKEFGVGVAMCYDILAEINQCMNENVKAVEFYEKAFDFYCNKLFVQDPDRFAMNCITDCMHLVELYDRLENNSKAIVSSFRGGVLCNEAIMKGNGTHEKDYEKYREKFYNMLQMHQNK